jgi:hypothetical protein
VLGRRLKKLPGYKFDWCTPFSSLSFFSSAHSKLFSLNMSSAYGVIPKPKSTVSLDTILPIQKTLRNGVSASLQQVDPSNKPLVSFLKGLCNTEINSG